MKKLSILKHKEIAEKASLKGVSRKKYKSTDVNKIVTVIREMGYKIEK